MLTQEKLKELLTYDPLTEATPSQNGANKRVQRNNRLGIKGVYRDRNRYRAALRIDGKKIYLGTFDAVEDASAAYAKAANDNHGKFARAA